MTPAFSSTGFTYKGKRPNNEDAIFPENSRTPAENLQQLFLLCDGMGGHQKGEIASRYVCTSIYQFFEVNKVTISDRETILSATQYAESKIDEYLAGNPGAAGMGTTMCLVHLHSQGATIAHIGDSRVYLFRKGERIFQTKDHSIVQRLYDVGAIGEHEMRTNPRKNEIYKAIHGAGVHPEKPEVTMINDLQESDVFFLCSDGVLESFSDEELEELMAANADLDIISNEIIQKCEAKSTDNFSGYLIKLHKPI